MHEKSPGLELQTGSSAEAAMMMMMTMLLGSCVQVVMFKLFFAQILSTQININQNFISKDSARECIFSKVAIGFQNEGRITESVSTPSAS